MLLEVNFPPEKEHLNACVKAFNELCERGEYPNILEYTPFELYTKYPKVSTGLWKEFLLDPLMSDWYASERKILLRSQVNKLIREAGTSKSTASAQTLAALLKQLNDTEENTRNDTVIIYNFVPVSEEERKDPLINVKSEVPDAIRSSIQIIDRGTSKNN